MQNALWCNALFEDDIRLEGVIESPEGVSLVVSQPYISGTSPTEEQIQEWFELQGYAQIGKHKWKHPNGRVVGDAHTGNLILVADGRLFPIDLHVEKLGDGDDAQVAEGLQ